MPYRNEFTHTNTELRLLKINFDTLYFRLVIIIVRCVVSISHTFSSFSSLFGGIFSFVYTIGSIRFFLLMILIILTFLIFLITITCGRFLIFICIIFLIVLMLNTFFTVLNTSIFCLTILFIL